MPTIASTAPMAAMSLASLVVSTGGASQTAGIVSSGATAKRSIS
jgi:hypothetical protein